MPMTIFAAVRFERREIQKHSGSADSHSTRKSAGSTGPAPFLLLDAVARLQFGRAVSSSRSFGALGFGVQSRPLACQHLANERRAFGRGFRNRGAP